MRLLWLYMGAFLIFPIIGEYLILSTNIHISAGVVTDNLIIKNIIFVTIILLMSYFIQNYRLPKQILLNKLVSNENIIYNRIITIMAISAFLIFIFGGYKIIFHLADRGQVRAGLGILGPIYTLLLSYLPIALIIYASVIYMHATKKIQKLIRKKLIIIYMFAIVLGVISGYKSVSVVLMVPGFVVLYFDNFKVFRMIIFLSMIVFVLTLFTALVRDVDIASAYAFLIYRATTMTAYGTIGVWNEFPHGVSVYDGFVNFLGIFGEKIASLLLGISTHEPEFLKTNLSRLITYKVYPDTSRALANSVNVTVTNFGHALYLFGKTFYPFYALIMGIIIGLTIRAYKKYIIKGYPLKASLVGLYFFAVIIPSLNSGGIFMLFSLPVLIYFFGTYIVLRYFVKRKA